MVAKVGLTGGIGSGKSTVARLFAKLGVTTIDADQVARELTKRGTKEFSSIVDQFGQDILDPDGNIDRARLGAVVFSDTSQRQKLESILHPSIRKIMHSRCNASGDPYCILEIPLLIETGQYREMDRILVVTCDTEIRIQRLIDNRDIDAEKIRRIIESQITDSQRIAVADDIIANDSSENVLIEQVDKLHKHYTTLFGG